MSREFIMPYSVAENVHTTATWEENASRPIVCVSDHKHHLEAYTLSFVAENSLPLSVVPRLIKFSQFWSRDPKALPHLQMNRIAAYKIKHKFSVYVRKKSSWLYEKYPFSINIDESTSNNSQKVFSILASYFDIDIRFENRLYSTINPLVW